MDTSLGFVNDSSSNQPRTFLLTTLPLQYLGMTVRKVDALFLRIVRSIVNGFDYTADLKDNLFCEIVSHLWYFRQVTTAKLSIFMIC